MDAIILEFYFYFVSLDANFLSHIKNNFQIFYTLLEYTNEIIMILYGLL